MARRPPAIMHWGMASIIVAMLTFAGLLGPGTFIMGVILLTVGMILVAIGA